MSPSIAAWAGLTFDLAELCLPATLLFLRVYAVCVGIFLQSPSTTMTDSMTSLLSSYFSFSCVAVDYLQSHSSAFACFFYFFLV